VRREAALQPGAATKGPAVDDQESAVAGGAGSPWQNGGGMWRAGKETTERS
jgi:hypothetical protein